MKIKELHIRNIASVEKADIDFGNDLKDPVTGEEAPVFLICGDTGSGKSVLLDAISLALYRKTPRTENVANPLRNEFRNKSGEIIRVNSISQYTRDGISAKDECYSEVVFEGNDGKDYKARLELGVYLSNTDASGKRHLLHRKPKWIVSAGAEEHSGSSAEEMIQSAVGLTFGQFCRMAMLAQGRFEAFLTGDKESREIILEQLTDTEKFSDYGAAVSRIFKRIADNKKMLEAMYSELSSRTISPDEEMKLIADKAETDRNIAEIVRRKAVFLEKEKILDSFFKASRDAETAASDMAESERYINSPEFRALEKFLSDWDATAQQRQLLDTVSGAGKTLESLASEEVLLKNKFVLLKADADARSIEVGEMKKKADSDGLWLEKEKDKESLYEDAGLICSKIRQWEEAGNTLLSLNDALASAASETESLVQKLQDRKDALKNAVAQEDDIQRHIDSHSALIIEANPEEVDASLKSAADKILLLGNLNARVSQYAADSKAIAVLGEKISTVKAALLVSEDNLKEKTRLYEQSAAEADEANTRFSTMSASLDDILRGLRKRLSDSRAEICPLCGQHINELHAEDEFKEWLSPLETEKRQKARNLQYAANEEKEARNAFARLGGELCTLEKSYETSSALLKNAGISLCSDMRKAGFAFSRLGTDDYALAEKMISEAIGKEQNLRDALTEKQYAIRKLQYRKDTLLKEKADLLKHKLTVEKEVSETELDLRSNIEKTAQLSNRKKETESVQSSAYTEISSKLAGHYPQWQKAPSTYGEKLQSASDDYKKRKESYLRFNADIAIECARLEEIRSARKSVLEKYPEWENIETASVRCLHPDIRAGWTELLSAAAGIQAGKKTCLDTIASAEEKLEAFYGESGMTEAELVKLTLCSSRIPDVRKQTEERRSELRAYRNRLEQAQNEIAGILAAAGVSNPEELPDKEFVISEIAGLDKEKDLLVARSASLQTRIDACNEDRKSLEKRKSELESITAEYMKWDTLNRHFGGTRFRTLVQSYILKPLLNNANIYLKRITDRYTLTCNGENEQLSIFVYDSFVQQTRSATVLSGGEKFMISLALSLALSSLNRPDMNVNILFIDEGFGTLDEKSLDSVMATLEKLQEIAGESNRRVGIISHREELEERIPVQVRVKAKGMGRSAVEISRG